MTPRWDKVEGGGEGESVGCEIFISVCGVLRKCWMRALSATCLSKLEKYAMSAFSSV